MDRRQILTLGCAVFASAVRSVSAQQPRTWRIGFLHPGQSALVLSRVVAFRGGLGASEEQAEIIVRLANQQLDKLPTMALELVNQGVQAICAVSPPAVVAAREATRTIPIVTMDLESDPVANGWAASLARPGGNLSGVFLDIPEFNAKSLQLLREFVPSLTRVAVLWHPVSGVLQLNAVRDAASSLGLTLEVIEVSSPTGFGLAIEAAKKTGAEGLLMLSSPLFGGNPQLLADLTRQHRLPSINIFPDFAEKGGLIGYGPELQSLFRQAGVMTRKVLQGEAISKLPIERPTRFKLVANLKTARELGLSSFPSSILLSADEVIE